MTPQRHVRIMNMVILYELKEPYVASGVSILGALEYDESKDRVKCHECGRWFESLGRHIGVHQLTASEYKTKHGLRGRSCLWNEKMRTEAAARMETRAVDMISRRKAPFVRPFSSKGRLLHEHRNVNSLCHAQVIDRIQKLGRELGRTPTRPELYEAGLNPANLRRMFSCSIRELIVLAGLEPRERSKRLTDEELLTILRNFHALHGRTPYPSDHRREMLPCRNTFVVRFGNWTKALIAAGLHKKAA